MDVIVSAIVAAVAAVLAGAIGGYIGARVQVGAEETRLRSLRQELEEIVQKANVIIDALDEKRLGILLYDARQYAQAATLLTEALKKNSEDSEILYYRGMAQKRLQDPEAARQDLIKVASEWQPWDGLRLGDVWLEAAEETLDLGLWPEATKEAQNAIRDGTRDVPKAYRIIGEAFRKQGQFQEALKAYDESLKFRPRDPETNQGKGAVLMVLARRGDKTFDDIIGHYTDAIDKNPKWAGYYVYRGLAHLRNGQEHLASKDFEEAKQLNPVDYVIWLRQGTALYEEAMEGWPDLSQADSDVLEKARDYLAHGVSLAPDRLKPLPLNWNSLVLQALGKDEEAVKAARESVRIGEGFPQMFPQNYQALICAYLCAEEWQQAYQIGRRWLDDPRSQAYPASRILIGAWSILAVLCEGREPSDKEIDEFKRDLLSFLTYKPLWDWRPSRQVLERRVATLVSAGTQLGTDVISVLTGTLTASDFVERCDR